MSARLAREAFLSPARRSAPLPAPRIDHVEVHVRERHLPHGVHPFGQQILSRAAAAAAGGRAMPGRCRRSSCGGRALRRSVPRARRACRAGGAPRVGAHDAGRAGRRNRRPPAAAWCGPIVVSVCDPLSVNTAMRSFAPMRVTEGAPRVVHAAHHLGPQRDVVEKQHDQAAAALVGLRRHQPQRVDRGAELPDPHFDVGRREIGDRQTVAIQRDEVDRQVTASSPAPARAARRRRRSR